MLVKMMFQKALDLYISQMFFHDSKIISNKYFLLHQITVRAVQEFSLYIEKLFSKNICQK